MSLMVQKNSFIENNAVPYGGNKQAEHIAEVYSKESSASPVNKTEQTQKLSKEEEMAVFKKEFYEELSKIRSHASVSNVAINISEDAFKNMKEDPAYREKILSLIKRDLESSYGSRNASVMLTVGSTVHNYRGDAWPVIADSEFHSCSQNSFYKKNSESKKEKQEELMERYLQKRQEIKHMEQEKLEERIDKNKDMREALRKSDAEAAYKNQILYEE